MGNNNLALLLGLLGQAAALLLKLCHLVFKFRIGSFELPALPT